MSFSHAPEVERTTDEINVTRMTHFPPAWWERGMPYPHVALCGAKILGELSLRPTECVVCREMAG